MINLIKADFKRTIKSKAIWIMPIIIIVMVAMISLLFSGLNYIMSLDLSAILGDSAESLALIGTIASNGYEMTIMNLQSDTLIYAFLVILLSVSAFDFSCGNVKNLLSIGISKKRIYFSKLITSCMFCVLGVWLYSIISTTLSYLFFADLVTIEDLLLICIITLKQLPIYISIIIAGHMFVFSTQRIAVAMLLYIGSFMFLETVFPLLDLVLDMPFKISLLMPLYQIIELTKKDVDLISYITIYASCIFYCVLYSFLGYYTFNKEELK